MKAQLNWKVRERQGKKTETAERQRRTTERSENRGQGAECQMQTAERIGNRGQDAERWRRNAERSKVEMLTIAAKVQAEPCTENAERFGY